MTAGDRSLPGHWLDSERVWLVPATSTAGPECWKGQAGFVTGRTAFRVQVRLDDGRTVDVDPFNLRDRAPRSRPPKKARGGTSRARPLPAADDYFEETLPL